MLLFFVYTSKGERLAKRWAFSFNKDDALKKAQEKYNAHFRVVVLKLHKVDDKDIIDYLDMFPNKTQFIKDVIRDYMKD